MPGGTRCVQSRARRLNRLAVALFTVFVGACGDGGTTTPTSLPANRVPAVSSPIPDQTVQVGEPATLDVSSHFADPDGDPLVYAASSSDPSVAAVSVSGATVMITAVAKGAVTVTVTATDPGGLSRHPDAPRDRSQSLAGAGGPDPGPDGRGRPERSRSTSRPTSLTPTGTS